MHLNVFILGRFSETPEEKQKKTGDFLVYTFSLTVVFGRLKKVLDNLLGSSDQCFGVL